MRLLLQITPSWVNVRANGLGARGASNHQLEAQMKIRQDSRRFAGLVVGGAVVGVSMLLATTASGANIVVNCIGEQTTTTTEGSTAAQNWPQVLGGLLGAGYTVNNDGVNAGTVVAGTAKSASSLTGMPGIIVIGPFAEHDYAATITEATWQTDYENLVDAYLALTPVPKVFVMTPPPAAFVYQSAAEQTFATTIVKTAVLAVAAAKNLTVIDLFDDTALGAAGDMAGDGHFNPMGMAEVAKLADEAITGTGGTGSSGASTGSSSGTSSGATTGASGGTGAGTGASAGSSGESTGATTGTPGGTGTPAETGATPTSGVSAATGTPGGAGTTTGAASGTTPVTGGSGEPAGTGGGGTGTNNGASAGTGGGTTATQGTQQSTSGCTMGAAGSSGAAAGVLSLMGLAFIVSRKRSSRRS